LGEFERTDFCQVTGADDQGLAAVAVYQLLHLDVELAEGSE